VTRCRATKGNGEPCKAPATGPHGYCWAHAPENAEQRRRMASKAARSKPNREIKDLKGRLATLADDVLEGRVDRGDAAVVNQIINTRARLVEIERKVKETEQLEERIEALEQTTEQQKGGKRWGA
jgi:hypothetical protein